MGVVAPLLLGLATTGGTPDRLRQIVSGRVAVVTGASRGIGRAVALRLAAVGAIVIGLARNAPDLAQLAGDIDRRGGHFVPLAGDLRDLAWAQTAGDTILQRWGAPGLIVSNAGHSIRRPLADYTGRFHDIARTVGVNYSGAVALALPLLGAMLAAGQGHLLSVTTVAVDVPIPHWSAYTASKAAHEAWLRAVAPELRSRGVAVTSLHLPRVTTAMSAPTAGRYPTPELSVDQAAAIVTRAIVTRPRFVVPWWVRLAGVATTAWPGTYQRLWQAGLARGLKP